MAMLVLGRVVFKEGHFSCVFLRSNSEWQSLGTNRPEGEKKKLHTDRWLEEYRSFQS